MDIPKNENLVPLICRIFFSSIEVATLGEGIDRFHKKVSFSEGNLWKEIYFTKGSADFTEKDKIEDPGMIIEQNLKFVYPGEDEDNQQHLEALIHPMIILFQLTSGLFKVFGSNDVPVRALLSRQAAQKNTGTEINLSCNSQEAAWWHDLPVESLPS